MRKEGKIKVTKKLLDFLSLVKKRVKEDAGLLKKLADA